jgi:hypothetical protein
LVTLHGLLGDCLAILGQGLGERPRAHLDEPPFQRCFVVCVEFLKYSGNLAGLGGAVNDVFQSHLTSPISVRISLGMVV